MPPVNQKPTPAPVALKPEASLTSKNFWFKSGAATGLTAAGTIFSFRNAADTEIILDRIAIGLFMSTAFTAAQEVGFQVFVARSWSVDDSGGTANTLTSFNNSCRFDMPNFVNATSRIGGTGGLTSGTRTLDSFPVGGVHAWVPNAAGNVFVPAVELIANEEGRHPIVLRQNEGIIVRNVIAWGAGGAGAYWIDVDFSEHAVF